MLKGVLRYKEGRHIMEVCMGKVIENKNVVDDYYLLTLECKKIADKVKEGQIIHVKCVNEGNDPLLRRPFSIYRFDRDNGQIQIMYLIKGQGTKLMKGFKKDEEISLIGPTGSYFNLDEDKKKAILIYGRGVGIAAVVSLAEKARLLDKRTVVILSGKTEEKIISKEYLNEIGCKVYSVNDKDETSSIENVGNIIKQELGNLDIKAMYTCGSNRVGRLLKEICNEYNIEGYISLEEHMACGIGVCFGCICKTKYGNKRVCTDGPVFNIEDIEI